MKKINSIMLIDDNADDNFIHKRAILKHDFARRVIVMESAIDALAYLKDKNQEQPDLIFLDINMPRMNGWEFIEEYKKLENSSRIKLIMLLTTSQHPNDLARAEELSHIGGLKVKPLTKEMIEEVLSSYF